MIHPHSSRATKKLLLQFIQENADCNKRSRYLQEIISMGKLDDLWRKTLSTFLDTGMPDTFSLNAFSKN
jgi:hypothetical protein